jgi:hypothetical protein
MDGARPQQDPPDAAAWYPEDALQPPRDLYLPRLPLGIAHVVRLRGVCCVRVVELLLDRVAEGRRRNDAVVSDLTLNQVMPCDRDSRHNSG